MTQRTWRPRKAVRELCARDERLARLVAHAGHPAVALKPSTFESIARAIVYQQLAGSAANAIWTRLAGLFPAGGFEPRAVLRKRDASFRKVGLSGPKTSYVKDLARHVADGRLVPEDLPAMSDEDVLAALTQVKGIGPWSAQMHLIFSLGRPDVWPTLDLGVRKGWARFAGSAREPTPRELEPLGDPYRPYRSVLAWYMWRVHDLGDKWTG